MNRSLLVALCALCVGPGIADAQRPPSAAVTGTVTYKQRVALPADAVVEVRLQDTSRADAAARTVAETTIATAGAQPPIPFRVEFDPAAIDPSHTYVVRATITHEGKLLFTSTTMYPVLTRGAGTDATIVVYLIIPESSAQPAAAKSAVPLEGTTWKLVALGDVPALAAPAAREATFVLHPDDHRLSGSGGCNRLLGTYEMNVDVLKITPSGTTMMACPPEIMQQDSDFVSALKMTDRFTLSGDTLELRNGNRVLARLMAQTAR